MGNENARQQMRHCENGQKTTKLLWSRILLFEIRYFARAFFENTRGRKYLLISQQQTAMKKNTHNRVIKWMYSKWSTMSSHYRNSFSDRKNETSKACIVWQAIWGVWEKATDNERKRELKNKMKAGMSRKKRSKRLIVKQAANGVAFLSRNGFVDTQHTQSHLCIAIITIFLNEKAWRHLRREKRIIFDETQVNAKKYVKIK